MKTTRSTVVGVLDGPTQQRAGDRVGQVPAKDARRAGLAVVRGAPARSTVCASASTTRDPRSAELALQQRHQVPVTLDGHHRRAPGAARSTVSAPVPAPISDHPRPPHLVVADAGLRDGADDGLGHEEVLPEALLRVGALRRAGPPEGRASKRARSPARPRLVRPGPHRCCGTMTRTPRRRSMRSPRAARGTRAQAHGRRPPRPPPGCGARARPPRPAS